MQKYASYKSAAKRIVRLMNEERELKKEAGFWNWVFPPVDKKAPQKINGKDVKLEHPVEEWKHPNTYTSASDSTGRRWAVPRAWLGRTPEGFDAESHENYDLSTGEYRPTFLPRWADWFGSIAKERDRINKATSEYWKNKNASK